MRTFRRLLLAYAEHHGATDKYNETVTCFYLLLIRDAMDQFDAGHCWTDFQLANPDLFGPCKEYLERWYPDGAAFTAEAKTAFRLPA
jgi:hypothetical protein